MAKAKAQDDFGDFDEQEDASAGGGAYFVGGRHVVAVERVAWRDGFKGTSFIVEGRIVSSSTDKPGTKRVWIQKGNHAGFSGRVKTCLGALMGVDGSAVTKQDLKDACGTQQPLAGVLAIAEGYPNDDDKVYMSWSQLQGTELKQSIDKAIAEKIIVEANALQA